MDRLQNPDIEPDSGPLTGEGIKAGTYRGAPCAETFWHEESSCAPAGHASKNPEYDNTEDY